MPDRAVNRWRGREKPDADVARNRAHVQNSSLAFDDERKETLGDPVYTEYIDIEQPPDLLYIDLRLRTGD